MMLLNDMNILIYIKNYVKCQRNIKQFKGYEHDI